jgi:glycosyltransferase involved in cell wall biosynthesis
LYRLQKALVYRGHEVHYLTLDLRPGAELEGVVVHRMAFPFRRRSGTLFWFCYTIWLPFVLFWQTRRLRPDRFLIFAAYYALPAWVAGRVLHVPRILFLRSMNRKIHSLVKLGAIARGFSSLWERLGVLGADRIVVMTGSMQRDLERWIAPRLLPPIEILPNDLPLANLPNVPVFSIEQRPFRVFTAGVLDKRKNIAVLLEAWGLLGDLQQAFSLVIAGEGAELAPLQALAASRSLVNVSFLGWSDEIEDELKRSDLLVHTALHEGMPNIVMEALTFGLPVLLADTPELREMAGAEELLFPPMNPRALADQLHGFLTDRDRRAVIGELSQAMARRYTFDWDSRAAELVERCVTH